MSDVMLHGVLNMPPNLWCDSPIDIAQRHSRYKEASQRIDQLERELAEARRDRDAWKANHDNQVTINRALRDRPDLGERAKLVTGLIQQRDTLAKALKQYREALQDGPENCSILLYEEVDEKAEKALAAVKGGEA